jgi:lysozyme
MWEVYCLPQLPQIPNPSETSITTDTISQEALDEIKFSEGFSAVAYWDHSQWTIGYGSGTYTDGSVVQQGDTVTEAEAERMLMHLLEYYIEEVRTIVTADLSPNQLGSLVSLAYNIGIGSFESSTLVALLNAGDYQGAADQFLRWNRAGGEVLSGLIHRRTRERDLFLNG